MIHRGF